MDNHVLASFLDYKLHHIKPYLKLLNYIQEFHVLFFTLSARALCVITGKLERHLRTTEQKCPPQKIMFYKLQVASSEIRSWKQQKEKATFRLPPVLTVFQKQHRGWRIRWILVIWSEIQSLILHAILIWITVHMLTYQMCIQFVGYASHRCKTINVLR